MTAEAARARLIREFPKVVPFLGAITADEMRYAGYFEAVPSPHGHLHWSEMHQWCQQQFGDRYTWFGHRFFFTNEQDRLLFLLRWG